MSHKFRPLKTINVICKRCGHEGNIEVTELQKNTAAVNFVAKFRTQISALESERDLWKQRAEKLAEAASNIEDLVEVPTGLGAHSTRVTQKAIEDFREALASLPRGEKEK